MRLWCALALACALAGGGEDRDRDGLDDAFEQRLLEKFVPVFYWGQDECDVAPAEFAPGERKPRVVARNGALYGQVFRHPGGRYVEIHYYHLWANDCGRMGHALDAEHVAALVDGERAVYWFAAAHQETVCDRGHGAGARELGAEEKGAAVWVSRGKHASYLSPKTCKSGCGSDRCGERTRWKAGRVINIGEEGALMNGAEWVNDGGWNLRSKLKTDFSEAVLALLEDPKRKGILTFNGNLVAAQGLVRAGNATGDGLETGNRHTGAALETGADKVKGSLKRSYRAVKEFLRGGKK